MGVYMKDWPSLFSVLIAVVVSYSSVRGFELETEFLLKQRAPGSGSAAIRPMVQALASAMGGCSGLKSKTIKIKCTHKIEKMSGGIDCSKKVPSGTVATFTCPSNMFNADKHESVTCGVPTKKKWSGKVIKCKSSDLTSTTVSTVEASTAISESPSSEETTAYVETVASEETTAETTTISASMTAAVTNASTAAATNASTAAATNASTAAATNATASSAAATNATTAAPATTNATTASATNASTAVAAFTSATIATSIASSASTETTTITIATTTLPSAADCIYKVVASISGYVKKCPALKVWEAAADCALKGGFLLVPDTKEKIDLLTSFMEEHRVFEGATNTVDVWVGIKFTIDWMTVDGTVVKTNPMMTWASGRPAATGDCVVFTRNSKTLYDQTLNECKSSKKAPYICLTTTAP